MMTRDLYNLLAMLKVLLRRILCNLAIAAIVKATLMRFSDAGPDIIKSD